VSDLIDDVRATLSRHAQAAPLAGALPPDVRRRARRARGRSVFVAAAVVAVLVSAAVVVPARLLGDPTAPLLAPYPSGSAAYGSPSYVVADGAHAFVVTENETTVLKVNSSGEIVWRHHFDPLLPGGAQGRIKKVVMAGNLVAMLVHVPSQTSSSSSPGVSFSRHLPPYAQGIVTLDVESGSKRGVFGTSEPPTDAIFDGEFMWIVAGFDLLRGRVVAGPFGFERIQGLVNFAEVEYGGGGVWVLDGDMLWTFDSTAPVPMSNGRRIRAGLRELRLLSTLYARDDAGLLWRYHARDRRFVRAAIEAPVFAIAAYDLHLYLVERSADRTAFRLHRYRFFAPEDHSEVMTRWLPGTPVTIAAAGETMWVATSDPGDLLRFPIPPRPLE